MLWVCLRLAPYSLRWRHLIFWALMLQGAGALSLQGLHYTPLRFYASPFAVLVPWWVQHRWGRGFITAAVGIATTLFGLLISPEQGIAAGIALVLWFAFLAWRGDAHLRVSAAITATIGIGTLLFLAASLNEFETLKSFSTGAFSFPLTPTAAVCLILFTYVAAACAIARWLRDGAAPSQVLPLGLVGLFMIPAAFGRADIGHLQFATGAIILGICYLQTQTIPRRAWAVAVLFVFLAPAATRFATVERWTAGKAVFHTNWQAALHNWFATNTAQGSESRTASGRPVRDPSDWLLKPCAVRYYSPVLVGSFTAPIRNYCVDYGYYDGLINAHTQQAVDRKLTELTRADNLLLSDAPLAHQFPTGENNPGVLPMLQGRGLFIPKIRRAPMTYDPLMNYIGSHFEAGACVSGGFQVWSRKASPAR